MPRRQRDALRRREGVSPRPAKKHGNATEQSSARSSTTRGTGSFSRALGYPGADVEAGRARDAQRCGARSRARRRRGERVALDVSCGPGIITRTVPTTTRWSPRTSPKPSSKRHRRSSWTRSRATHAGAAHEGRATHRRPRPRQPCGGALRLERSSRTPRWPPRTDRRRALLAGRRGGLAEIARVLKPAGRQHSGARRAHPREDAENKVAADAETYRNARLGREHAVLGRRRGAGVAGTAGWWTSRCSGG